MNRMQRTTRMVAILALAMILVGCNTPTVVVPPTQDIPSVRTEAASTVIAKITIEAALNPSPTTAASPTAAPAVITATTAPTDTPAAALPTLVPSKTATLRPSSGGTGSGSTGVIYPTATRRAGPDQAQLLGQTPLDGAVFGPGNEFDAVFTFKNIGTSTWNTNFRINAVTSKGTVISKAKRYMVRETVKPGDTTKIIADVVAPSTAGRYVQYWELANDNNSVFYAFYMVIDVK